MGLYLINIGPKDPTGTIPECLAHVMSDVTNAQPPGFYPILIVLVKRFS